ncbi:MAG: selenocysteine-specific translation elongation factor [Bacteroidetes bacterium]|nr:selenocysteine-specific translation elongation factor [Bacteroidota bacterium]
MPHFIIGTAGHIDHGKTALVKALTGIDSSRLKEEKERGITIDIGFAYWKPEITIIDVPGHERFIRNMVAGVHSIDFVLFVIAADDGIMPQTVEHLEIIRLLDIRAGCVAMTKCDLVDEYRRQTVAASIRKALVNSPLERERLFEVSSIRGDGIDELRDFLQNLPATKIKRPPGPFRMFVDRSFSIKGHGTVITGTVLSGTVNVHQAIELLPSGQKLRVRGLQQHIHTAERLEAGDRAAINVAGIDKRDVRRGHVVADPAWLKLHTVYTAKLFLLSSARSAIKGYSSYRVLIGTQEIFVRIRPLGNTEVSPGSSGYVSITFEEPVCYLHGDRFVLRESNSASTLGGGRLLSDLPATAGQNARFSEFFEHLEQGDLTEKLAAYIVFTGRASISHMASIFGAPSETVRSLIGRNPGFVEAGPDLVVDAERWNALLENAVDKLALFHTEYADRKGMRKTDLRHSLQISDNSVWNSFLRQLLERFPVQDHEDYLALGSHEIQLSPEDRPLAVAVEQVFAKQLYTPPLIDEVADSLSLPRQQTLRLIRTLTDQGILIKTDSRLHFHHTAITQARRLVIDFIGRNGHIEVGQFKEKLNISRKFALSLLEYFDSVRLTQREDHYRILVPTK